MTDENIVGVGGRTTVGLGLGLVLVVGGGIAAWKLSQPAEDDGRVQALLARLESERQKDPPDQAACRSLLHEIRQLPAHASDPRLVRAAGRLLLLQRKAEEAWQAVADIVEGMEVQVEDLQLGAEILMKRYQETGDRVAIPIRPNDETGGEQRGHSGRRNEQVSLKPAAQHLADDLGHELKCAHAAYVHGE